MNNASVGKEMNVMDSELEQDGIKSEQLKKKKEKENKEKYADFLPWESRHISPFIPKLEQLEEEIKLSNEIEEEQAQKTGKRRSKVKNYSDFLKDLHDDEDQQKFTLMQFQKFVELNPQFSLSFNMASENQSRKDNLLKILRNFDVTKSQSETGSVVEGGINKNKSSLKPSTSQSQQMKTEKTIKSVTSKKINYKNDLKSGTSNASLTSISPEHDLQSQSQVKAQQLQYGAGLSFDYEQLINHGLQLKPVEDFTPWNEKSPAYVQKIRDWDFLDLSLKIKQNSHQKQPFYLESLFFKEERSLDQIRRGISQFEVEQKLTLAEKIIGRNLIEIMHQRDILVKPNYRIAANGLDWELVHDIYATDRSFIVEHSMVTLNEIYHEYPLHFTTSEFVDFLSSSGIPTKTVAYQKLEELQQQQQQSHHKNVRFAAKSDNYSNSDDFIITDIKSKVQQNNSSNPILDYDKQKKESLRDYFLQTNTKRF